MNYEFLPINKKEMQERGWNEADFVYVTGDAYVDHPSFGVSIISRVLEAEGYRVAVLSQPDYKSAEAFKEFGRPRLGFLVTAGNIDSMVAHYTVAKRKRTYDYYSPGGKMGLRPDRACIVYTNRIREAYGDVPVILGGLEASLRRFAHYDYWDDKIRRSILVDSKADMLTYGMGENILRKVAALLDKGVPIKKIRDVRGTVFLANKDDKIFFDAVGGYDYNDLKTDKKLYSEAFGVQYNETDAVRGRAVTEYYDGKMLVQNPPMPPLTQGELDYVYSLPYARRVHPIYEKDGGVPGIEEVKFSITHNRGCFGACNFCALAFHQGRSVRARSAESVLREAKIITEMSDFKGYIHDIGGPTANFRGPACEKQLKDGVCAGRKCLTPTPCKNLICDHSEYQRIIESVEALPRVKKVFIRSGIRFDYLMYDKDDTFFRKLVRDNVSGQLKVAPEHCCDAVLTQMGKPSIKVYDAFKDKFFKLTKEEGKEQYIVPYLMSSHPGSTLNEAVELALYLKKWGYTPEQVQDFYPTPGTASTVMYYTGINPLNGKKVSVTTDYREKQLQRALLQSGNPKNADLVREALERCGRTELIGYGSDCLVRPKSGDSGARKAYGKAKEESGKAYAGLSGKGRAGTGKANKSGASRTPGGKKPSQNKKTSDSKKAVEGKKPFERKKGWAKPKKKK